MLMGDDSHIAIIRANYSYVIRVVPNRDTLVAAFPGQSQFMIKRLTGTIQPYAWGSRTMIPELLGLPPTGEPQAELWLGAHPMAPSLAEGERLDQLSGREPGGCHRCEAVRRFFGPRLPFLMKIIAADRPLSLQAHPSRAQAEAGFAEEELAGIPAYASNRTYRDTWPARGTLRARTH